MHFVIIISDQCMITHLGENANVIFLASIVIAEIWFISCIFILSSCRSDYKLCGVTYHFIISGKNERNNTNSKIFWINKRIKQSILYLVIISWLHKVNFFSFGTILYCFIPQMWCGTSLWQFSVRVLYDMILFVC